jgi:hypothetical protein
VCTIRQAPTRPGHCPWWCVADRSEQQHVHVSEPDGPAGVRLVQPVYDNGEPPPVRISMTLPSEPMTLKEAQEVALVLQKHCTWATAGAGEIA